MAEPIAPQTLIVVGPDHPGMGLLRERLRERGALLAHTDCLPQAQRWLATLAPDLVISTHALQPAPPCPQLFWDGQAGSLDRLMAERFPPPPLPSSALLIDRDTGRLALSADPHAAVTLPGTELRLLLCLLRHQGRAVSRRQLIQDVWPLGDQPLPRSVDQVVHRLRELLAPLGLADSLRSLRGLGYRLDLDALDTLDTLDAPAEDPGLAKSP